MNEPDPPESGPPGAEPLDAVLRAAVRRPAAPEQAPDGPPDDDPVDDGRLRAWRAGALSDDDAAAFEALLADDAEARALAAASVEPAPDALLRWAEDQAPRSARPARRWGGLALAAVALVAAGAAWLWRGRVEVPDYVTSPLAGAAATTRGDDTARGELPVFRPASVLTLTLRPAAAGAAPPVAAFVARVDGPLAPVTVEVDTPEGGAVVIRAGADRLFGADYGPWRLYVALGEAEGAAGQAFDAARAGGRALWFEYPLVYAPAPDDGGSP